MLFPTFTFTCFFLCFLLVWWKGLVSRSLVWKMTGLLVGSLIFYGWANPRFLLILLGMSTLTWLSGRWVDNSSGTIRTWKGCLCSIVLLLPLLLWKYTDWVLSSWNDLAWTSPIELPGWVYPVGLSFFTFHALSWFIAVWKRTQPSSSWLSVATHVSFFPSLLAGPVLGPTTVLARLREPFVWSEIPVLEAITRIGWGMTLKWVFASQAENWADPVFQGMSTTPWEVWAGVHAYTLQIFFDFAGYSSMAIGIALLLGFRLPENFTQPYLSTSFQSFWRNWHRSLSFFFRDHLYIDVFGGNRHGFSLAMVSACITMVVSGIWHGANLTFVIWGAWHAALLALERLCPGRQKWPTWLAWFITFEGVVWGWVFFRAEDVQQALALFQQAFAPFSLNDLMHISLSFSTVLWIAIMGLFLLMEKKWLAWQQAFSIQIQQGFSHIQAFGITLVLSAWVYLIIYFGPVGVPPFIYNGF